MVAFQSLPRVFKSESKNQVRTSNKRISTSTSVDGILMVSGKKEEHHKSTLPNHYLHYGNNKNEKELEEQFFRYV